MKPTHALTVTWPWRLPMLAVYETEREQADVILEIIKAQPGANISLFDPRHPLG